VEGAVNSLILKKMFVAVDREHVNVTKKHSVAFALVSRDLKVTACFAVTFICHCHCASRSVYG